MTVLLKMWPTGIKGSAAGRRESAVGVGGWIAQGAMARGGAPYEPVGVASMPWSMITIWSASAAATELVE